MHKFVGLLRLMRPANIVTAIADILAGTAIAGFFWTGNQVTEAVWLVLSTIGLYGGGVVLNDVFDAELDKIERPERPIPSGLISRSEGFILGYSLLFLGILSAFQVSANSSGFLASGIAIAVIIYDRWAKHHDFFGPLNMGLCRGLNLLLGISIIPSSLYANLWLAVIPIVYIAAITIVSKGEVYGGRKGTLYLAALLYVLTCAAISFMAIDREKVIALWFVILLIFIVFPPLVKAIRQPGGKQIGRAVKAGVIGLIAMNAAWAAAFGMVYLALVILTLLPLSILLARVFAVT